MTISSTNNPVVAAFFEEAKSIGQSGLQEFANSTNYDFNTWLEIYRVAGVRNAQTIRSLSVKRLLKLARSRQHWIMLAETFTSGSTPREHAIKKLASFQPSYVFATELKKSRLQTLRFVGMFMFKQLSQGTLKAE